MKKILIVDDEAHIRMLLEQTLEDLEDEGVELFFADNGLSALDIIREERPNLVFLDVMMPKMNGMDVCKKVKSEDDISDTFIILLTAKGQEMDKQKGAEVGANIYMTKPFDPDAILDKAKEILELISRGEMAVRLKSILNHNPEIAQIIQNIADLAGEQIAIWDKDGRLIFGDETKSSYSQEVAIEYKGELIGYLRGDNSASIITRLIIEVVEKENAKKSIGNEVLSLYREINLIYAFSERLADTIELADICRITVEEATRLIEATEGLVFLCDEPGSTPKLLAGQDHHKDWIEDIARQGTGLYTLFLADQSDILDSESMPEDLRKRGIQALLFAPFKVKNRTIGGIILSDEQPREYTAADLKLLTTLALQAASAIESALLYEKRMKEAQEREETMRRVNEATARFVPKEFILSLGRKSLMDVLLGDQVERVVTVVFVDIRDYTTLAEQMTPEENFKFVNAFNMRLGPVIRERFGFINQYLGDGFMAIFPGSPNDALVAAVEMQDAVKEYNKYRASRGRLPIRIGIGMHTGPLIMGITGDRDRLDAATISDTVNTAARIESLTKHYGCSIMISRRTLEGTSGFHCRHLGLVQVKGKTDAVSVYDCIEGDPQDVRILKLRTMEEFSHGISAYFDRDLVSAIHWLEKVLDQNPQDRTSLYFLERAKRIIDSGSHEEWTGIEKMESK